MGKITGFLEIGRRPEIYEDPARRIRHYREFTLAPSDAELADQGARCMDCGIPYCLDGCPVSNVIPDWNDLVCREDWEKAYRVLSVTNNFPEFTGRVCPAPCEASCTLNLNDDPVTIKSIELAIVERAFAQGWAVPRPAAVQSGRKVAVVGSGPAGLACAQQLARAGHGVVVFERNNRIGGLLRYGIPDFKMEKECIDRRIEQMQAEGVVFRTGVHVGECEVTTAALAADCDAVALCGGCEHPRDLEVPGRDLEGVHFAMDFLLLQNRRVAGDKHVRNLTAKNRKVVVIGGGDTGSDCIGTARRQGARSIVQFEVLARPPEHENKLLTWPNWPLKLRTSSSQKEGCERSWSVSATRLSGRGGRVEKMHYRNVEWMPRNGGMAMLPAGDEQVVKADLILLAMGYLHPRHDNLLEGFVSYDQRGNVLAGSEDFKTSMPKVFASGDMRRGQSLVVWAIREGRQCARAIDVFLRGFSHLPR